MTNIKIVTVIGARPQFIKAATVSRALANYSHIEELIVHTGQHYDTNMSQVFFDEMHIPAPHVRLDVTNTSHAAMTGTMMMQIEEILLKEKPDYVLLYGDTNSTLAGALSAVKLGIKVIHVEAGLRSFNMAMPEEVNRILTDRVSNILLCPTELAVKNLQKEGYDNINCKIYQCGDVMQDGALYYQNFAVPPVQQLPERFALVTLHRAENTDNKELLSNLVNGLNQSSKSIPLVFPIHPRTKKAISEAGLTLASTITCIDPVGYLQMIWLIKASSFVITDSGGLQKEAFFFARYCITLRQETEWLELVDNGFNTLVGSNVELLVETVQSQLEQSVVRNFDIDLYGKGKAANRIAEIISNES